jgi:hypothetical protein
MQPPANNHAGKSVDVAWSARDLFQTPWSDGTPGDMPTALSFGAEGPFHAPPGDLVTSCN